MQLSVCTIMKNEEDNIAQFLESLNRFGFDDIVLVDTGSQDKSVEIAKKYIGNIHYFEWVSDFAAARNYAASLARYDNILVLDVDEIITDISFEDIEKQLSGLKESIGRLYLNNFTTQDGIKTSHYVWLPRIYNRLHCHFAGSIHEQIEFLDGRKKSYIDMKIEADHIGYNLSIEKLKKKTIRNNEILFKEIEKNPNNPYLYFQVGQSFLLINDHKSAVSWFEKAIGFDLDTSEEYVSMIVTGYGECLMALGRYDEALGLAGVYNEFSSCPEYVFMMGQIYLNTNQLIEAYKEFFRCLTLENPRVEGMNTFFPLHNIGVINEMLGEKLAAKEFYTKAAAYGYSRSIERLKELQE